jgi:hypothetical protein
MTEREVAAEIAALIEQCPSTGGWVFLLANPEAKQVTWLTNKPDDLDLLAEVLTDIGLRGERLPN